MVALSQLSVWTPIKVNQGQGFNSDCPHTQVSSALWGHDTQLEGNLSLSVSEPDPQIGQSKSSQTALNV